MRVHVLAKQTERTQDVIARQLGGQARVARLEGFEDRQVLGARAAHARGQHQLVDQITFGLVESCVNRLAVVRQPAIAVQRAVKLAIAFICATV
jgi:hypothetical protein